MKPESRDAIKNNRKGLASLSVLLAGCLWGLYWVPVRALAAAGLEGAFGSLVIVAFALVLLLPAFFLQMRSRARSRPVDWLGVLATAAGGAAFMLYSVGLVEGRISAVILLFYLTPVWTTLIIALILRWPVPGPRYIVIGLGLVGLILVLGGRDGIPIPRASGEWLGLVAGLLWSVASVGMRLRGEMRPLAGVATFIVGALVAGALLLPMLNDATFPIGVLLDVSTLGWILITALVWWIGSMLALVWAAARLDPARVGLLLMTEVLVGVISSVLFTDETLTIVQMAGGALLVTVGLLDAVLSN